MKITKNGKSYHATKISQFRCGKKYCYQVSIDNQDAGNFWAKNMREAINDCIEANAPLFVYPPLRLVTQ